MSNSKKVINKIKRNYHLRKFFLFWHKITKSKFWQKKSWRITFLIIFLTLLGSLIYLIQELLSPKNFTSSENYAVSTQIFDRNGQLLYEVYGDENRLPIDIK